MARKVNLIEEINYRKDTWKLKIRIINLWCVDKSLAPSLEMIFMDRKGDKIQAMVKYYHLAQWESQLEEGNSYIAENFDVVSNEGQYRGTKHPFKLIFQKGTIMNSQDLSEIPQYAYHFTTFEEIVNGLTSSDVLVDVIGEFIDIELSQANANPKKVIFCMKDQRLANHVIEAKNMIGKNIGKLFYIPRMSLSPSQSPWPFKLTRRRFPLIVSYAMTINKSQGQSVASVGLYLPRPVFSHGQLYVAFSRVQSKHGLKILIHDKEGRPINTTTNVVFKEVFQNL